MTDAERRRYEMFVRIDRFGQDNNDDFPDNSIGKTQFDETAAVIDLLDEQTGEQAESGGEARFGTNSRATARENLRDEMMDIRETARAMAYQFPGIDLLFRMPRNRNDQDLLAAARAFYNESATREAAMIEYGLPATFRATLLAMINAFEASLSAAGTAIDERVAATAEIGAIVRRGMIAKRILDGVVKNKYRNNVGKLAAWLSASHLERAPKGDGADTPNP